MIEKRVLVAVLVTAWTASACSKASPPSDQPNPAPYARPAATPPASSPATKYASATYHPGKRGVTVPQAPLSVADLELMKKSVLFGEQDQKYLRMSRAILEPQVDQILDVWYGFVGSQPHLLAYFSSSGGEVRPEYLKAVRVRFGQWILDTADADYDQAWIDYQVEIGRRHHRVGKNKTDGADAVDHIPLRHIILLTFPIVHTLRPFLEAQGHSSADVDRMQQAWLKSVLLQVTLWSHPYVQEGDF